LAASDAWMRPTLTMRLMGYLPLTTSG
jgi:hypothetical protein